MNDETHAYLAAFALACILTYLLIVILTPSVELLTAAPTPTVDVLGLWGSPPGAAGGPNGPAVVPNNANNGDSRATPPGFSTLP